MRPRFSLMNGLGVATVLLASLVAPQAAQAFCTQVYNSGYYDSTSAHGQTLMYFDPWMNSDCAGLDPYATYVYYDWVSTSIQGPVGSETGPSTEGAWWAESSADIPIVLGGYGQYVVNGGGDEHICNWYWYQCYNETIVGWASYDVYVPPPTVTLSASNYQPVVGSGPVQITAQFDPSYIYPEFGNWEGCTPSSAVECSFSPDTPGVATVTYSTFVVNVLIGAQVQIDVQQPQQQPVLMLIVDSDWNLDQGIVGEPNFLPGEYYDEYYGWITRPVEEVGSARGQLAQLFAYFAYPSSPTQMVAPPYGAYEVTFSLENTTSFSGYSNNAGDSTLPDYSLTTWDVLENEEWPDYYTLTVPVESGLFFHVPLRIKDYGGFTLARAQASNGAQATLQLPIDNNNNGIPDSGWLTLDGPVADDVQDTSEDTDAASCAPMICSAAAAAPAPPPSQGLSGDGLTRREEYRGFNVRKQLRRTSPLRKDLFIASAVRSAINAEMGLGYATEPQGLPMRVHHIYGETDMATPEYGPNRVINFQQPVLPGHNDQKALLAINGTIGNSNDTIGGLHVPINPGGPCPTGGHSPNETTLLVVDATFLQEFGIGIGQGQPQIHNQINRTIAHEVGHGLHVKHRGSTQTPEGCTLDSAPVGNLDSVMSSEWQGTPPGHDFSKYNNDDRKQMRLHTR